MDESPLSKRIFSLAEAGELLPVIRTLTADAVETAEELAAEFHATTEGSGTPLREEEMEHLGARLSKVVSHWAMQVRELGVEPKGPWLVDFDNGYGYYCWQYPEERLSHFHGYQDGFAGRMKIV